jgi:calcium-translocating P-type ATPase
MAIHRLGVEEALASLGSSAQGLAPEEARRRLAEYGPNRIERARRAPLLLRFVREFTHLFAAILWLAAGLCFAMELVRPGEGMRTLGLAILAVIGVNGVFSFWQEYRAERALAALERLLPSRVRLLRGGRTVELLAAEVVPGDVVLLAEGDEVPADCRVIQSRALRLDIAMLTGESRPVGRDERASDEDDALQNRNTLLAGTSVVAGTGLAVAFATGERSELGRIARLSGVTDESPSPLQLEITRLSRLVAALATALGVVFFAIGRAVGVSLPESAIFAVGLIVANVPEGLLPTVTLSLAMAAQRMARRNALIRHLPAVETLGSATVICTDKTGTLTWNRMRLERVFLASGAARPEALAPGAPLAAEARRLLEAIAHCHDLRELERDGARVLSGDPMELALVEGALAAGVAPARPKLDELPFSSDRRRLSTLHRGAGGELLLYTKGAPEVILPRCARFESAAGPAPLEDGPRAAFAAGHEALAREGLRVLAVAWRPVADGEPRDDLERELVLAGLVGLEDPPRPDVPEAIERCRAAGVRVIMVTGDHPETAVALARRIGLITGDGATVLTGDRLDRLTPTELQLALDAPEIVLARLRPEHKLSIVEALSAKREIVAVTGDGVNDAPALRRADIGIAMGVGGSDVAKEAADMVLLDDHFASIVAAIEEGRAVFDNLRKFMTYILTSNVPEAVPYLAFVLARIPLPLTILQILAIDLGTDMIPALGLGAERPDAGVMRRPPRPRAERLLNRALLTRAYLLLGPLEAAAAMAAYGFVLQRAGWSGEPLASGDPLYLQATTATFCAVIVMQVANVFVCRSASESVFARALLGNRLILAGVAVELVLALVLVYTPRGQALLGTAPLDLWPWLVPVPFALALIALDELRKAWLRRRLRASGAAVG